MDTALEITAKNGRMYRFVESFFGSVMTFAFYSNKWNHIGRTFRSFQEAENWIKQMDAEYEASKSTPEVKTSMPASAYYSITGWYGD